MNKKYIILSIVSLIILSISIIIVIINKDTKRVEYNSEIVYTYNEDVKEFINIVNDNLAGVTTDYIEYSIEPAVEFGYYDISFDSDNFKGKFTLNTDGQYGGLIEEKDIQIDNIDDAIVIVVRGNIND